MTTLYLVPKKFNDYLLGEATGLSGKNLAEVKQRIESAFADHGQFERYMQAATDAEIAGLARRFALEMGLY